MPTIELPLSILIGERSQELNLSRSELVARCGYKNISKGLRRLDRVHAGDLDKAVALLKGLHKALNLPPEIIEEASTRLSGRLQQMLTLFGVRRLGLQHICLAPALGLRKYGRLESQVAWRDG
jgi:hypothetical protein